MSPYSENDAKQHLTWHSTSVYLFLRNEHLSLALTPLRAEYFFFVLLFIFWSSADFFFQN